MNFRTMMQNGPAKALDLFARLADTSDGAVKTREKLFAELKSELEFHASLEEQHLFPLLRKQAETKDLVADAVRDNKELLAKLAELDGLPKNDPTFSERLAGLQKAFRQHARDEKKEFLPAVQRALSDEQVQHVTERMEASLAEAEQAKHEEAEERRAKARQEREDAEFAGRQAELLRARQAEEARQERSDSRQAAEAAPRSVAMAGRVASEVGQRTVAAAAPEARRGAPASALTNMFLWPWLAAMQSTQQGAGAAVAGRGPSAMEEVIPLGEEVLEVGKRTENRAVVRVHRSVVKTPVERQVTLQSERVVVERRRPTADSVTGEILTELTVEVIETEEVPMVSKRARLREEVVVRTERTQRVETVRDTLLRDEVDIEASGRGADRPALRAVATER